MSMYSGQTQGLMYADQLRKEREARNAEYDRQAMAVPRQVQGGSMGRPMRQTAETQPEEMKALPERPAQLPELTQDHHDFTGAVATLSNGKYDQDFYKAAKALGIDERTVKINPDGSITGYHTNGDRFGLSGEQVASIRKFNDNKYIGQKGDLTQGQAAGLNLKKEDMLIKKEKISDEVVRDHIKARNALKQSNSDYEDAKNEWINETDMDKVEAKKKAYLKAKDKLLETQSDFDYYEQKVKPVTEPQQQTALPQQALPEKPRGNGWIKKGGKMIRIDNGVIGPVTDQGDGKRFAMDVALETALQNEQSAQATRSSASRLPAVEQAYDTSSPLSVNTRELIDNTSRKMPQADILNVTEDEKRARAYAYQPSYAPFGNQSPDTPKIQAIKAELSRIDQEREAYRNRINRAQQEKQIAAQKAQAFDPDAWLSKQRGESVVPVTSQTANQAGNQQPATEQLSNMSHGNGLMKDSKGNVWKLDTSTGKWLKGVK